MKVQSVTLNRSKLYKPNSEIHRNCKSVRGLSKTKDKIMEAVAQVLFEIYRTKTK